MRELDDFMWEMKRVLDSKGWKHGWDEMTPKQCLKRIRDEEKETRREVDKSNLKKAEKEIIDVANFAYFCWWNIRRCLEVRDDG